MNIMHIFYKADNPQWPLTGPTKLHIYQWHNTVVFQHIVYVNLLPQQDWRTHMVNSEKILDPIKSDYFVWYDTAPTDIPIYHYHNAYEIFFFIRGNVHFCVEEYRFNLEPGNILLIQPWENHRVESYGNSLYERFAVNISYHVLEQLSTAHTNLSDRLFNRPFGKPNIIATGEEECRELASIMHKLHGVYSNDRYGKDVLCNAYMAQALVLMNSCIQKRDVLKLPNTMPDLVEKTLNFINKNLPDYITLEELSKELYHNGIYISRRFKEITGLTIKDYILRKRISLSQHYLTKGYSVADSALKAGFSDPSNFTRTFTKYVGITPKKYQKRDEKITQ